MDSTPPQVVSEGKYHGQGEIGLVMEQIKGSKDRSNTKTYIAFDLQNELTSQPSASNALIAVKHQHATKKLSKRSLKAKKTPG